MGELSRDKRADGSEIFLSFNIELNVSSQCANIRGFRFDIFATTKESTVLKG